MPQQHKCFVRGNQATQFWLCPTFSKWSRNFGLPVTIFASNWKPRNSVIGMETPPCPFCLCYCFNRSLGGGLMSGSAWLCFSIRFKYRDMETQFIMSLTMLILLPLPQSLKYILEFCLYIPVFPLVLVGFVSMYFCAKLRREPSTRPHHSASRHSGWTVSIRKVFRLNILKLFCIFFSFHSRPTMFFILPKYIHAFYIYFLLVAKCTCSLELVNLFWSIMSRDSSMLKTSAMESPNTMCGLNVPRALVIPLEAP